MNKSLFHLIPFLFLFLAGCQKEVTIAPQAPTPPLPYFKATLNGLPYSLQAEDSVNLNIGNGSSAPIFSRSDGGYGYSIKDIDRDSAFIRCFSEIRKSKEDWMTGVEIEFTHFLYNHTPNPVRDSIHNALSSQAEFEILFSVGAYPYQYEIWDPSIISGVNIIYRDVKGGKREYWSTAKHPNASGNTFQIVESTKYPTLGASASHNPLQLVKVKFNCTLYNPEGDSLMLKDGEWLGLFENYFSHK
jgi:hypothetical protein